MTHGDVGLDNFIWSGVSVALSGASRATDRNRPASEPAGRSGDRHGLLSIDPSLRRRGSPPARIVLHIPSRSITPFLVSGTV